MVILKDTRLKLLAIMALAFLIRYIMISIDPCLYEWDERYHALVAKNMMSHPLKPMLRVLPLMNYDFKAWCCNHIWLHKQPLFLWQMALSMKLFGVSTIAMRLPSAIMGSLLVIPVFRIGKLVDTERTGYIAALLCTTAYYQLELTSGAFGMEHNDLAFLFYNTLALWSFVEYQSSLNKKWIIWIGIFAGAAVLCKWLVGLLVFGVWGIHLMIAKDINIKSIIEITKSFFISLLVFVPWQLYIFWKFPREAKHEFQYNSKHIWEAVEGHSGDAFFHFEKLNFHYPAGLYLLAFLGIALAFFKMKPKFNYLIFLYLLIPYLFFSLIAKSKLPSYTYFVSPAIYIFIGLLLNQIYLLLKDYKRGKHTFYLFLTLILIFNLRFQDIFKAHIQFKDTKYIMFGNRPNRINNQTIYKELDQILGNSYDIVLNCKGLQDIEAMFFSNQNVYSWYPTEEEYLELKTSKYKRAAFKSHTDQSLPAYMTEDPELFIIDRELK